MSREMKKVGKQENGGSDVAEKVLVAVKASREIPRTALCWALTHVVQPGDCITLLVVVSSHSSGRKFWGFPRFAGDCASGNWRSHSGAEQKSDITYYCSQMILQLHHVYDPKKINVKIKIVSGTPCGAVAAEAKKKIANWVVLDKHLKHEEKQCMEDLQCNIVVMKRSQPKILRLNLIGSPEKELEILNSDSDESSKKQENVSYSLNPTRGPLVTASSSPETFTATEAGTSSVSSCDPGTSPFFATEKKDGLKQEELLATKQEKEIYESSSETDSEKLSYPSRFQPWMAEIVTAHCQSFEHPGESSGRLSNQIQNPSTKAQLEKLSNLNLESGFQSPSYSPNLDFNESFREVMSIRTTPSGSPPLCSVCQHKAPAFGKPPRWFTYAELELATGGFSQANFLAEGGFGSVHKGVLPDGLVIAVKQHKLASSQGDKEFCSEVEVLSCAQQRNVVMLIGFCIEDGRRLLVYEYICNGSLDSHLYGHQQDTLAWNARKKVAVGAARGLRYLHEECRVGCIVHRDLRPNNILITHDFEPLACRGHAVYVWTPSSKQFAHATEYDFCLIFIWKVGDFGLARWQPDGEMGVETRVIGTFGYLAPEYAQSGQITEKADVYSFGVVLVELVTGRKAVDLNRSKGQQCLAEWARPLLDSNAIDELVDPLLGCSYIEHEVYCMLHAASLCIRRDPEARPRMSQVLRILEGDAMDSSCQISTPGFDVGSRSGRILSHQQLLHEQQANSIDDEASRRFSSTLSPDSGTSLTDGEQVKISCEEDDV